MSQNMNKLLGLSLNPGKGKVVAVHTMMAKRGSRGIAPPILNLGTRQRWVINFLSHLLYPKEETQHLLNRWLGGSDNHSGHFGEEEHLLPYWDLNPGYCSPWPSHCTNWDILFPGVGIINTRVLTNYSTWPQSHSMPHINNLCLPSIPLYH
jgi:hypothetical protein